MFVADYPTFRPFWFLESPHLQTVASFFSPIKPAKNPTQRYVVRLPDNDRLVIHDNIPKKWITGDRIVILLHGLCGSHRSTYMRRVGEKLRRNGFRTIRVDMRGAGDSETISRGHAHAASSGDLEAVVHAVHSLSPLSPLTLLGFSLGANIVLKLCGSWSIHHPQYVDSAIAVSPPIDLIYCSGNMRQWGNRMYDLFFCTQLKVCLERRRRLVTGLYDNGLKKLPNRLVHLDDQFVAPVNGFAGARDYYEQASSGPQLRDIDLQTLIIAAQDDPLIPIKIFDHWVMSPQVDTIFVPRGGHLGFVGSTQGDPDSYWLDWRIVRWVTRHDAAMSDQRIALRGV